MSRRRWFYSQGGMPHGPFKAREIVSLVQDGTIKGPDLIWKRGRVAVPASRCVKLFRRQPTIRTRNMVVATAGASLAALTLAVLLAFSVLMPGAVPESVRTHCIVASIILGATAVVIPGICAIAIDSTFIDVPVASTNVATPPSEAIPEADHDASVGTDATDTSQTALPPRSSWRSSDDSDAEVKPPRRRPRRRTDAQPRRTVAVALLGLVGLAAWLAAQQSGPFRWEAVSGAVTYTDGTRLPIKTFRLTFHPLARPSGAVSRPPIGTAYVNGATGTFDEATSNGRTGIVAGRHKVTVHTTDGSPLPDHVAGRQYSDATTTALIIDTAKKPIVLRLLKP